MSALPISIARQLLILQQGGGPIPFSKMQHESIQAMLENGILQLHIAGRSRKTISLPSTKALEDYLKNHFSIAALDFFISYHDTKQFSQEESIRAASNSKLKSLRSFQGFPVTCLTPLSCTLHGKPFQLEPVEGIFTFIHDFEAFLPPSSATIVGIENPTNFRQIQRQATLFEGIQPLFVSRYPQSKDLLKWLQSIPNPYLHFGDFDPAGLNIYWHEYRKHLGKKAQMFIPQDLESKLSNFGNRDLYAKQQLNFDLDSCGEDAVKNLARWIEQYGKGLEQEAYLFS